MDQNILAKLNGIIPASVIAQMPGVADSFQINTPLRIAHFIAQCYHESGGFTVTQENLNYSAQGLANTFPGRYANAHKLPNELALSIARNPQKIANNVYANRMGNGNEASGEGWKYRGRGYIQLTGKDNYKLFDATVADDIINNPDAVALKYPLMSAAWFFSKNGLNALADTGATAVQTITKRINGGYTGLNQRIDEFNKIYKAIA